VRFPWRPSASDDFFFYFTEVAPAGNKIFLFHHCFKSKEERKALRLEQGYKFSSYFTDLVAINLSGELESKKTLFNLSGFNRRHINTKFCRILNDGRILIYTNDTDKFRFGTYKID
jgi:hypothetical protein